MKMTSACAMDRDGIVIYVFTPAQIALGRAYIVSTLRAFCYQIIKETQHGGHITFMVE